MNNRKFRFTFVLAGIAGLSAGIVSQTPSKASPVARAEGGGGVTSQARVQVTVLRMPYVGERNVAEFSPGPDALLSGGLLAELERAGALATSPDAVRLTPKQDRQYGAWQRLALANGDLADAVAGTVRDGRLVVGLLANCSSLLGMLGGVQHAGAPGRADKVGLVYIDAHGDFNTPETTLSGMLGGMDVAAAAGLCLTRLRVTSKLDPPVPPADMILAGVRDTDPLEQELIDQHKVPRVSVADLRSRAGALRTTFAALSARVARIYVHIDMDVLDPAEVPGHSLSVRGGPTSAELAEAVTEMFRDPKVVAIGIASTPTGERDAEGRSRKAAYTLIRAAIRGAQAR
jgi:arginase